jgi:hypothetical protein
MLRCSPSRRRDAARIDDGEDDGRRVKPTSIPFLWAIRVLVSAGTEVLRPKVSLVVYSRLRLLLDAGLEDVRGTRVNIKFGRPCRWSPLLLQLSVFCVVFRESLDSVHCSRWTTWQHARRQSEAISGRQQTDFADTCCIQDRTHLKKYELCLFPLQPI